MSLVISDRFPDKVRYLYCYFFFFCLEIGTGCSVTLCDRNRKSLRCENSEILITNVTKWKTEETSVTTFQNFRRMCMGKKNLCDISGYCQNGERLKVSYLCISGKN